MEGIDSFKLLNAVRAIPTFQDMNIIVAMAMSRSKIAQQGGLPPGITVFPKPVPFYELKGYIQALVAGRGARVKSRPRKIMTYLFSINPLSRSGRSTSGQQCHDMHVAARWRFTAFSGQSR